MCGLAGVILGTKRRRYAELAEIAARFTQLLVLNERRGRHATGVALVDRDGGHELLKRPIPAREFVALDLYREVLGELSNSRSAASSARPTSTSVSTWQRRRMPWTRTTCILGHTRWPTRGTPAPQQPADPPRPTTRSSTKSSPTARTARADKRTITPRVGSVRGTGP